MKRNLMMLALSGALLIAIPGGDASIAAGLQSSKSAKAVKSQNVSRRAAVRTSGATERVLPAVRYRINPGQSRFMVEAFSGGLLWFMGHAHHFAIRDFSGEAQATPDALEPASLQMTVKAASLEETGENFTEQEKKIINDMARKQVLETEKYPDITFKSTDIKSTKTGENQFDVEIGGDLTLHGITHHTIIPARVMLSGNTLHANGEFSIRRSDFNVKTKSVKAGTIRIRNKVKFTFAIAAIKY